MRFKDNGVGFGGAKGINQHIEVEKNGWRGGVEGKGHGFLGEDELRSVEDGEDANCRRSLSSVQLSESCRLSYSQVQQPSQGRVCWERFIHVGSPKVLLVESDDSTRHVVTALLRNCSYQVIAVSNGIEAWKILEDLNNQIDLVLTEVVMSGISGICLLSNIMNHKSFQNIPVIMMSNHDSMGIVLKCLSKGAVDYLVKPIRKNEVKNLWQHVWRRCHSSSGSGSESCIRYEHYTRPKCAEESNNGSDSDNENHNRNIGLQIDIGSDNGSGTQSSWTKRAAEVESSQPPSALDKATEHDEQNNQLDNIQMGKDLEIGVPKNTNSWLNAPNRKTTAEKYKYSQLDLNLKIDQQNFDENVEMRIDDPKYEWIKQAMNLPREVASNNEHHRGNLSSNARAPVRSEASKSKDKIGENVEDLPSLELSLKRLGDDLNMLRPSQVSAITRYNTGSTGNQGQIGDVGSCSPPNNSSDDADKQSNSDPPNQISNNSSNNNNMGSTTNKSFTKPALATDKAPKKSTLNCSDHSSVFQPVQNGYMESARPLNASPPQVNDTGNHQFKIHQHHHHHHHHHHHNVLQRLPVQDEVSKSTNRNGTETLQCGSINNCRVPTSENVANRSLNGSASGSNKGSNFINGSSLVVNAEGTNLINDSGVAVKGISVDNGSGSGVGVDQNRSAQREAALNKFRQKRKERCFDKRVRYQGRKKLADQRPRVHGQFVRENKRKNADS